MKNSLNICWFDILGISVGYQLIFVRDIFVVVCGRDLEGTHWREDHLSRYRDAANHRFCIRTHSWEDDDDDDVDAADDDAADEDAGDDDEVFQNTSHCEHSAKEKGLKIIFKNAYEIVKWKCMKHLERKYV